MADERDKGRGDQPGTGNTGEQAADEERAAEDEEQAAEDEEQAADEELAAEDEEQAADEERAAEDEEQAADEERAAEDEDRDESPRSSSGLLWKLLTALAVVALLALGHAVFRRVRYPFELEWMEGAVVDHVRVVLSGEPLYRQPSLEFTPFIYTPFYYYVCALGAAIAGPGFAFPRVVSTLGITACLFLIYGWVRRETQDSVAALIAAGLFAATYDLTGYWFDIARPDSMALGLLLGGLWVARFGKNRWHPVAVGLLLYAAFMTKQTMLLPALAGLGYHWLSARRRGAVSTGVFVLLVGGTVVLMDATTGGWFSQYVFVIPSQHSTLWGKWRSLLQQFFWDPVAVMVLWTALGFATAGLRQHGRVVRVFYGLLVLLALGSAYFGILHQDGYVNVLMPAYAVLAITTGITIGWLRRAIEQGAVGSGLASVAALSLVLQFGLLTYDPRAAVLGSRDVLGGQQLIAELKQAPSGEMLMLGTGYYPYLAGHPEIHAHAMALADVIKIGDTPESQRLQQEILGAIRQQRFDSIVLGDGENLLPASVRAEVPRSYVLQTRLLRNLPRDTTRPLRGFRARPAELWVARRLQTRR